MASQPVLSTNPDPDALRMMRTAPNQRKWWIIGSIGCLLATGVVVWFGLAATLGKVSWTTVSYHVVDAKSVDLTYDLDRPVGTPVVCTLRALAKDFSSVGSVEVPIPAATEQVTVNRATIATTSLAVMGEVQFCRKA